MLMLVGLHGTSALKILLILCLNYAIAVFSKGSTSGPMLTWVFNILTLFANERNAGYRFATLHPALGTLVRVDASSRFPAGLMFHYGYRICTKGYILAGMYVLTLLC